MVIGSEDICFQSEYTYNNDYDHRGSLNDWKEYISTKCKGNPILILAISTAFAGVLLKIAKSIEIGGIGIHLTGDSSQGKSTALQCAASVWGPPNFIRTWRATSNGMEGTSASRNDTFVALDESGECEANEIGKII